MLSRDQKGSTHVVGVSHLGDPVRSIVASGDTADVLGIKHSDADLSYFALIKFKCFAVDAEQDCVS